MKRFSLGCGDMGSSVYIEVNTFKQMWSLLPIGRRGMILLIIPSSFVRIRLSIFGEAVATVSTIMSSLLSDMAITFIWKLV